MVLGLLNILGPTLFLLYINDLPDDIICDIVIYADDTTIYSTCDQASDLWQQIELTSELESDLHTKHWAGAISGFLISMLGTQLNWSCLTGLINTGVIDVKMDGSVLDEKLSFQMASVNFLF